VPVAHHLAARMSARPWGRARRAGAGAPAPRKCRLRRLIDEAERSRILHAPMRKIEDQAGKVGRENLRRRECRQRRRLSLVPQADGDAGLGSPARPARWSAEARETRTVSSRVMPVEASNTGSRCRPLSMTIRTPSIVMEVSAIDVASTILRVPGRRPDRGVLFLLAEIAVERRNQRLGRRTAPAAVLPSYRFPPAQGRKARIEPLSVLWASTIARVTASSIRSPAGRSW
jgi:hypothetical protein